MFMKQIDIYNVEGMLKRFPDRIEVIKDSLCQPVNDFNVVEVQHAVTDLLDEVKDMANFVNQFQNDAP